MLTGAIRKMPYSVKLHLCHASCFDYHSKKFQALNKAIIVLFPYNLQAYINLLWYFVGQADCDAFISLTKTMDSKFYYSRPYWQEKNRL